MSIHKHISLIPALIAILALAACDRHSPAWEQMEVAEGLMNSKPDSALAVLNGIPASDIKGKETSARYALLKSMALDKNYIDTTAFDVLQPAIDYYLENGTPDERLRTYYYQGRIYQNQGDDDSAMLSFLNGCELKPEIQDSLLLAHTLVAQGTLYLKQYKTDKFIQNNLEAAKLYEALGKDVFAIKSYTNAVDGYVMQDDKTAADSLLSVCLQKSQNNPDGQTFLFPSYLSYTVEYGSHDDIKAILDEFKEMELTSDEAMDFAKGYMKLGDYTRSMEVLSDISVPPYTFDSLKYDAIRTEILEKQGKYEQALNSYKDYTIIREKYQRELISHDLLFSDKKHQLEIQNLMEIRSKDRIIEGTLCGILALVILLALLYYRGYINKTKRVLAEKENENLRLERDKKALEAGNLEKEKQRLEAEQRQHELESDNLRLEISRLEGERDHFKELQEAQSELPKPIQEVIRIRLDMLNGLLAKEITSNESHAKQYNKWLELIRKDKKEFMDSTRLVFAASHPKFMKFLVEHGLTTEEINYLCLYAIGLRGKEVGEYIQLKRHYNISSEIRKKLAIDEHETNIGIYVRRQIADLEK